MVMGSFFFSLILFSFACFASADIPPPLRVLVPLKVGFEEFVSWKKDASNNVTFDGFSVQVFLQALKSPPPYVFIPVGNGKETPQYDHMVEMVAKGEADAIVADLTITRDRMDRVDFTMPYIASALVMVKSSSYASDTETLWDFMKPFSLQLWVILLVSFVATGGVLFLLENKNPDFSTTAPVEADSSSPFQPSNPSDPSSLQRPGPPIFNEASRKRRILNAYWFTSLCVFAAQQESVRTHLGRIVTVAWLFVMLIINSSYTASLASFLSAQNSNPTIESLDALLKSNVLVGYQEGSFMKDYLTKNLGFPLKRLRSYDSKHGYAQALAQGGIKAILDELPYAQILIQSDCDFTTVGDQLANFGGFGFAFSKNSTLTHNVSKGILSLAEDGTLRNLKTRFIMMGKMWTSATQVMSPLT